MRSIEWTLLEWIVPAFTWLYLELNPIPHLVLAAMLLALIGGLVFAISVVFSHIPVPLLVASPASTKPPAAAVRMVLTPTACDGPVGGNGPRAPGVATMRLLAAI